ncbi:MAG: pyruvate, phosphate dikinase [Bdellovibrionaceae bacterium]|nr:pyruvate, phosphate dikinase [Pseudobdellovibrionaceae bacterium]
MQTTSTQGNPEGKTMENKKYLFFFSEKETDGNAKMKDILGGKGANLAEMCSMGIPVPPGFTLSTELCKVFYENGQKLPEEVKNQVVETMDRVGKILGKTFGDPKNPLLVSVRSGARASMPGMMDTILNLGLNDETVKGLAEQSSNPRFAKDSYRRFIQMYSNVVMGMNASLLEVILEDYKAEKNYELDTELTEKDLDWLVQKFKEQVEDFTNQAFPTDPWEQLWGAITAVFKSWNNSRAITYRELNGIPAEWGTAVNIQSMVFGNMGEDCATGVAFTRDPSTGEKVFFGEFLVNAQGEDVVAGIRTPQAINKRGGGEPGSSLEEVMPESYVRLVEIYNTLEKHYRDMQDLEFTIERGNLWMLQTRNGKRTTKAALNIALDMLKEGLINEEEAILRIQPSSLDQLLHPTLDPKAEKTLLAKGLPASPGGACGKVVFTSEEAKEWRENGIKTILVRIETSPEDIEGMVAAQGILTTRGGMTSHAAVVARGMGKCCVSGCENISVDYKSEEMKVKGYVIKKGDVITLDGSTGEVFLGEVATIEPKLDGSFSELMALADKYRTMGVRTNADTPKDAKMARDFGAEGIGLCRTEHMFFGPERIDAIREMIMAESTEERRTALDKLLPFQKEDFLQIFNEMVGLPVTIRLLDPPLHEFLPHADKDIEDLAKKMDVNPKRLKQRIQNLVEANPMLGHRGCRLAISYPEIYEMQARAIAMAAAEFSKAQNSESFEPEIMIPLVGVFGELKALRALVEKTVRDVQKESGQSFKYKVGTMIELPRAAVTADEVAEYADFFSFGTNDLTQTALGLSRDDAGKFLGTYVSEGLLEKDPFVTIDIKGVGKLVSLGVELGRRAKPQLKVGICGEHGGDPSSIEFFQSVGLDYVSCSPYRVPIARLAAAHAALKEKNAAKGALH